SFFFQAGVGIRDRYVTGVQTCALPIYTRVHWAAFREVSKPSSLRPIPTLQLAVPAAIRPSDYLVQMPAAAPAAADVPSESGIPAAAAFAPAVAPAVGARTANMLVDSAQFVTASAEPAAAIQDAEELPAAGKSWVVAVQTAGRRIARGQCALVPAALVLAEPLMKLLQLVLRAGSAIHESVVQVRRKHPS